jgi:hypothetical protein
MKFLAHQDGQEPTCPSCRACEETCAYIICCPEAGRTEAFSLLVAELSEWMRENKTHPDLVLVILEYDQGQGKVPCVKCARELPFIIQEFCHLAG